MSPSYTCKCTSAKGCDDPSATLQSLKQVYESGLSMPSNFSEGTVFNIRCELGYAWTDGILVKTITCMFTEWQPVHPSCVGKNFNY